MLETLETIAMEILSFLASILLIAGVLGGIYFWVDKLRGRRELMEYLHKEKLKAELKE